MIVTDEMVERAAEGIARDRQEFVDNDMPFPASVQEHDKRVARAALTAALGDVDPEPLEDVLDGWSIRSVFRSKDGRIIASVWPLVGVDMCVGSGPTIDAAIRDAVANATQAKGGAE